jgi:hypothetical protein
LKEVQVTGIVAKQYFRIEGQPNIIIANYDCQAQGKQIYQKFV